MKNKAANNSRMKGFRHGGSLLSSQIRKATETRGFAVSRVLTHWTETVGEELAAICRPVDVSYGRQGLGATLTVLTTGAQAPMLEMQKERLRDRVNAAYGYNAISRVRITQTAATGFAEGQAQFAPAPKVAPAPPDRKAERAAREAAAPVSDEDLRKALEALGQTVLSKRDT